MRKFLFAACSLFLLFMSNFVSAQCLRPDILYFDSAETTQTSLTFTWTPMEQVENYQLILVPAMVPGTVIFDPTPPASAIIVETGNVSTFTVTNLTPATRYRVAIKSICSDGTLTTARVVQASFCSTYSSNDECNVAVPVTTSVGTNIENASFFIANNLGASPSMSIPSSSNQACNSPFRDVWFKFTATESAHSIVTSGNNLFSNSQLPTIFATLYSGSCDNLAIVSCQSTSNKFFKNLTIGQEYYLRFDYPSSSSSIDLRFRFAIMGPIENDICTNAVSIPIVSNFTAEPIVPIEGNLYPATASANVCNQPNSRDVWFKFTATQSSHGIYLESNNTAYVNKRIDLYSGPCESLTSVSCAVQANQEVISNNLIPGQEYFVRVYLPTQNLDVEDKFKLVVFEVPSNDSHTTPRLIEFDPFEPEVVLFQYLNCTTVSPVPTSCSTNLNLGDVWYSIVAPCTKMSLSFYNTVGQTTTFKYSLYKQVNGDLTEILCDGNLINYTFDVGSTYLLKFQVVGNQLDPVKFKPLSFGLLKLPDLVEFEVSTNLTELVENVLINNSCVTVANVTGSGGATPNTIEGIGTFSNISNIFPINNGIILATGNVSLMEGYNNSIVSNGGGSWGFGDSDLEAIVLNATGTSMNSQDVTKLEFDFTAPYESINFNFLFASEEYGSFQCFFSDAFAFLLTDTVTNQTVNLAVVPGTSMPISVITIRDMVHNSNCESANDQFFRSFSNGMSFGESIIHNVNLNGMTELLTASSPIVPGRTYHVKLVIADRQDTAYDSAVFIQAGSFLQGPPSCTNKIELTAFYDLNNDGLQQDSEPLFSNGQFLYTVNDETEPVIIQSPIGKHNLFDETAGSNTYNVSYQINPEYLPYFSLATNQYNNLSIPSGSGTQTIKFPISITQTFADVSVSVIPYQAPRAGANGKLKVQIKNNGNENASGTLSFEKPSIATITNVTPAAQLNATGFTFNYSNLLPNETKSLLVTYSIPPIPQVNIDDVLTSSAQVTNSNDAFIIDNAATLEQIVVAAYDPNDKQEKHGGSIEFVNFSENDYLEYTIRFQNTGVRIEDILGPQYNLESLRMISASHTYYMQRIDNEVKWFFDFIQLPGAVQSPLESIGYLTFKIKLNRVLWKVLAI